MMQLTIPHRKDDAEWRRFHDEKPRLDSFTPVWTTWATKKGKPGIFGTAWNRRFWVLVGSFLLYFDSDKPTEKVGGSVYLVNARVALGKGDEDGHSNIIRIQPMVPRRPGMSLDDPSNEWVLSFDDAKEMQDVFGVR